METKTVADNTMTVAEKAPYLLVVWGVVGGLALLGTGLVAILARRKTPEQLRKEIAKLEAKKLLKQEELGRIEAAAAGATPHQQ